MAQAGRIQGNESGGGTGPSSVVVVDEAVFLEEGIDTNKYVTQVLKSGQVAARRAQLQASLGRVQEELEAVVRQQHEPLLAQVGELARLDEALGWVRGGVQSVAVGAGRLRAELGPCYAALRARTAQLGRVQATTECLRRLLRFLAVCGKLRGHLEARTAGAGGAQRDLRELPKAAACLRELEALRLEADLSGLELVDSSLAWLAQAQAELLQTAQRVLLQGLETHAQSEVALSLQVFHNLGLLPERLQAVQQQLLGRVQAAAAAALQAPQFLGVEAAGPGSVARAGGSGAAAWRAALWSHLEKLLDALQAAFVQVCLLQRVLGKLRDPLSHRCLLEELGHGPQELQRAAWAALVQLLREQLAEAARASAPLEAQLVHEYPRLARLFQELLRRLQAHYELKQSPLRDGEAEQLRQAVLERFERAFLHRALLRLLEPVQALQQALQQRPLAPADLQALTRALHAELEPVRQEPRLALEFCRQVLRKALLLLAQRLEAQAPNSASDSPALSTASSSSSSSFVSSSSSSSSSSSPLLLSSGLGSGVEGEVGTRVASCHAAARQLHMYVTTLSSSLPPECGEALQEVVQALEQAATRLLRPVFERALQAAQALLAQMPSELAQLQARARDAPLPAAGSAYLQALARVLQQLAQVQLPAFGLQLPLPPAAAGSSAQRMLVELRARLAWLFIRHASLLRPLSEMARLQLAQDITQLELALASLGATPPRQPTAASPHAPAAGADADALRALRALKPLLFRESTELARPGECAELQALPSSVVLHQLLSRAPQELPSPWNLQGLSPAQYVDWLERHSEHEAWLALRRSLEHYAKTVAARGDQHFAPVYPLFFQLAQYYRLASS